MATKIFKRKTSIFIIMIFVLLLSSFYYFFIFSRTLVVTAMSFEIAFGSADTLSDAADLIVIGKPLDRFEDRQHKATYYSTGAIQDFYTITRIQVEKIIKGPDDLPKTINVHEPVMLEQTFYGKVKTKIEDYSELQQGRRYLLFLIPSYFTPTEYVIINMNNGKFSLDEEEPDDRTELKQKLRKELEQKWNIRLSPHAPGRQPELQTTSSG